LPAFRPVSLFSLLLLAHVVLWAQPTTSTKPAVMSSFETVKLADGIYAFISPESNGAIVTGNSLLVIGDDGALVVDSGHFPSLTARMIHEIKQLTSQPVRFLVNTHWHPDHNAGNGLYRREFPGIEIVSTPATREEIETVLPKKEVSEATITEFEDTLKKGTLPNGKPLAGDALKYYQKVGAELIAFRPELKAADHALPTTTFETAMSVYLGKREVQVLFLGRGNTGGDAVIYIPASKVVATGDLVVYPVPYPFGSYIGEWIATLKKLDSLDANIIVPGHGPVLRDKNYLELNIKLLDATQEQTAAAARQGLSLEDTLKKIDLKDLREQFVKGDSERGFFFDGGYLPTAVGRAYREAKEGPLHDEN